MLGCLVSQRAVGSRKPDIGSSSWRLETGLAGGYTRIARACLARWIWERGVLHLLQSYGRLSQARLGLDSFVHGVDGNPLTELAHKYQLVSPFAPYHFSTLYLISRMAAPA